MDQKKADVVIFVIGFSTKKAFVAEMGGMACASLGSLRVSIDRHLCAVATRGGYAVLWDYESDQITKIRPDTYGPVECITFLNGAQHLLLLAFSQRPEPTLTCLNSSPLAISPQFKSSYRLSFIVEYV